MKFLHKLTALFAKKTVQNEQPAPKTDDPDTHRYPVTARIMAWLDEQHWTYEHRTPDDDSSRTHHLILGFADGQSDWTCVFRINEYNQLITVFGILTHTIPTNYYASVLVKMAHANLNIAFGSLEIDPFDGEVRAKLSIDAEFGSLSDKALACYLHGISGLVEIAQKIFDDVMSETSPSPSVEGYLSEHPDGINNHSTDISGYFLPTFTHQ